MNIEWYPWLTMVGFVAGTLVAQITNYYLFGWLRRRRDVKYQALCQAQRHSVGLP